MRNDIKLAAKVITNLDTRWQLWNFGENNEKNENQEQVEDSLEKIIYLRKCSQGKRDSHRGARK